MVPKRKRKLIRNQKLRFFKIFNKISYWQDEDPTRKSPDESFEKFENYDDIEYLETPTKKSKGNVTPKQKEDSQKRCNIPGSLDKINNSMQVKDLKRKQPTSSTFNTNVQYAMEHLDNIVFKMKNTEDENVQFGRYVTSQLSSLPPIWSVILRSEIQNVITNIVVESLFGSQSGTSKGYPLQSIPYYRFRSRNASSYSSPVSSYHSRPSTPNTTISPVSATPNPSSSSHPPSSSLLYLPSSSSYPPPSLSPYPPPSSPYPPPSSPYPPLSPLPHPSHIIEPSDIIEPSHITESSNITELSNIIEPSPVTESSHITEPSYITELFSMQSDH